MRKLSSFLLLTILLVSFTCSFVSFNILPVQATTETRYLTSTLVDTAYNLSTAQTAAKVETSIGVSAAEESIIIYCGIKIYVLTSAYASTLISGSSAVAIITRTLSATENWDTSTTWAHAANATAGKAVKIEVYADTNNPPTTLRYTYKTENMTEFTGISGDTWTVYYTGRSVYSSPTKKTTAYFSFGITANYNARIDGFAVTYAPPATLTYANVSAFRTSDGLPYVFGGQTASFVANWTASGTLDRFILSTNSSGPWTNETAISFSANTWSNTTKVVNATGDIQLGWRIYANSTTGTANDTGIQTLYIWKYVPPPSDHILGHTYGFSWTGGIYFKGAHDVIYVAYLNSTVSPWEYNVAAYDVNTSAWFTADMGISTPYTDNHYDPSISVVPDGRLIVLIGYFTPLKFVLSTNNATTETNTSKLISQWESMCNMSDVTSIWSYPVSCHFTDRLVVFGREGSSGGGNVTELIWKANTNVTSYVTTMDNSYTEWSFAYLYPYLDADGRGIFLTQAQNTQGNRSGWYNWNKTSNIGSADVLTGATLKIYANLSKTGTGVATCTATLMVNGTTHNNTMNTVGWKTYEWDVSAYVTSGYDLQNASLCFTEAGTFYESTIRYYNISWAAISYNYTGFGAATNLFLPPVGFDSTYWQFTYNSTGTIIGAGYGYDSTAGHYENVYGMYSNDKGDTWCRLNETTPQTLPYNLTGALLSTTTLYTRCSGVCVDENGKLSIACQTFGSIYALFGADSKLAICSYNSTLGSATGVWSVANATDAISGAQLTGYSDIMQSLFLDSWYGRPSIWIAPDTILKYVRIPNSVTQFLAVSNDTTHTGMILGAGNIQESLGYYSLFTDETNTKALGTTAVGTIKQNMDDRTIWGSRYSPPENGTLDWGVFYGEFNYSAPDANWKMAIYFAGNMSLLGSSTGSAITSGIGGTGWSLKTSFPSSSNPIVYQGVDYWVCFEMDKNGTTSFYATTDAVNVNYTFYAVGYPYIGDFPSTITPTAYQNQSISILCASSLLHIRGLGVMEFTDTGTNTSIRGVMCQFRTYVHCDNGLSYSYLRSNNSGVWDNTTYSMSLSSNARYVYFNVTISATAQKVLWEIWVNDSNNNWGHTNTQTLTLSIDLIVISEGTINHYFADFFIKELFLSNNIYFHTYTLLLINKELGLNPSGSLGAYAMLLKEMELFELFSQGVAWFAGIFQWKDLGFESSNTLAVYASQDIGKELAYSSSPAIRLLSDMSWPKELMSLSYFQNVNVFSSSTFGKELGFANMDAISLFSQYDLTKEMSLLFKDAVTVWSSLGLGIEKLVTELTVFSYDTGKPLAHLIKTKELSYNIFSLVRFFDTSILNVEFGFLNYARINPLVYFNANKELAFNAYGLPHLFSQSEVSKELQLGFNNIVKLWGDGTVGIEKGFVELSLFNFDKTNPLSYLNLNKELAFNMYGLPHLFSQHYVSQELLFGFNNVIRFFSDMNIGKELTIPNFEVFNHDTIRLFDNLAVTKEIYIAFTTILFGNLNILSSMIPIGQINLLGPSVLAPSNFWKILAMFSIVMLMATSVFLVEKQQKKTKSQRDDGNNS